MAVFEESDRLIHRHSDSTCGAGPLDTFAVATYNVHRWTGVPGGNRWNPDLARTVIEELDADVIALQEVLRPHRTEDPVLQIARDLDLNLAFVPTRMHRHGELGNAILSRWPMRAVFTIDLSFSRFEHRAAVVTQFQGEHGLITVVATHLALVDRTRKFQVRSLLEHPWLQGPTILLGDMNAWRRCRATRQLDEELVSLHDNRAWPPTYPSAKPVLALDRVYARGAHIAHIRVHDTPAARRGSDHLPVVARVAVGACARHTAEREALQTPDWPLNLDWPPRHGRRRALRTRPSWPPVSIKNLKSRIESGGLFAIVNGR